MARGIRLTDKIVKAITSPNSGSRVTYCGELAGFGVRVTAAGVKSFVLNYVAHGRERRVTIGRYPTWSVAAAREHAQRLKRDVDLGGDPLADRGKMRSEPSLLDVWKRYEAEHLPKRTENGRRQERRLWESYVLPILGKDRKLSSIMPADVESLRVEAVKRAAASKKKRPKTQWDSSRAGLATGRAVVTSLKTALNLASKTWRWIGSNPATGVKLEVSPGRERFLSEAEIARLIKALDAKASVPALCLKFLLLTGARRGETMRSQWNEFTIDPSGLSTWRKPSHHTKTKRVHLVPLSVEAVAVLLKLKSDHPSSRYVFRGRRPDAHVKELKTAWRDACTVAKIEHARIHDLRHTYASLLASRNLSLPLIGKLLGHTQQSTTQRYAHLSLEPLAEATSLVGRVAIQRSVDDSVASDDASK
jgi:integrase